MDDAGGLNEKAPPAGRRRWVVAVVWALVLGLLAVVGLGLVRSQQGSIGIGSQVPDLVFTTFDGDEIPLRSLDGKVTVINFWASWCKTCEQEAAELEQAHRMYQDRGVVFLGVDYVDTEAEARAYLQRYDITYLNGPDLGTRISQAFRIRGVPETYVIGPDGRVAQVKIGPYTSLSEIVGQIEAVLAP